MTDDDGMAKYKRQQRITALVVAGSMLLIVTLVIVAAVILSRTAANEPAAPVVTYDSYRPAWESAMAKAGVDATFPVDPVDLTALAATGMHDFSATFTADEISALLTMYRFEYQTGSGLVSLSQATVSFPSPGRAGIAGRLVFDGSGYRAEAEAPVAYSHGDVLVDPADANLKVEGFSVGGDKRAQALAMLGAYFSSMVSSAPRLTVTSAEVVANGLKVVGTAPDELTNPPSTP